MQIWYGREINEEHWGWKLKNYGLHPVFKNGELVPKCTLKYISCWCLKNCGLACDCRKQRIKCSVAYKTCYGI